MKGSKMLLTTSEAREARAGSLRPWLYSDTIEGLATAADLAEYLHTVHFDHTVIVRVRVPAGRHSSRVVFGRLRRFTRASKGSDGRAVVQVPGVRSWGQSIDVTVPREAILAVVPGRYLAPYATAEEPTPIAARRAREAVGELQYTLGQAGYNAAIATADLHIVCSLAGFPFGAGVDNARNAFLHSAHLDGARTAGDLIARVRTIAPDLFAPAEEVPHVPAAVEVAEETWESAREAVKRTASPASLAVDAADAIAAAPWKRDRRAFAFDDARREALEAYDARARAERDAVLKLLAAAVAVAEERERVAASKGAA